MIRRLKRRHAGFVLVLAMGLAGCNGGGGQSVSMPEQSQTQDNAREIAGLDPARVVTEVALRAPWPWYVNSVHCGEVTPALRPPAPGMTIRLHQRPETCDQWKAGDYEVIQISVMPGDYGRPEEPILTGQAAAALLQEWQGRRVFIWRSRRIETWPDYEDAIRAALAAASGELVLPEGSDVVLGPASFGEIHLDTAPDDDHTPHGFYYEGTITDRATGQTLPLSLHFMHPLYDHLDGMNERDVLAVHPGFPG